MSLTHCCCRVSATSIPLRKMAITKHRWLLLHGIVYKRSQLLFCSSVTHPIPPESPVISAPFPSHGPRHGPSSEQWPCHCPDQGIGFSARSDTPSCSLLFKTTSWWALATLSTAVASLSSFFGNGHSFFKVQLLSDGSRRIFLGYFHLTVPLGEVQHQRDRTQFFLASKLHFWTFSFLLMILLSQSLRRGVINLPAAFSLK